MVLINLVLALLTLLAIIIRYLFTSSEMKLFVGALFFVIPHCSDHLVFGSRKQHPHNFSPIFLTINMMETISSHLFLHLGSLVFLTVHMMEAISHHFLHHLGGCMVHLLHISQHPSQTSLCHLRHLKCPRYDQQFLVHMLQRKSS